MLLSEVYGSSNIYHWQLQMIEMFVIMQYRTEYVRYLSLLY